MKKGKRNIGEKKLRSNHPIESTGKRDSLSEKYKKPSCLYLDGVITKGAHGKYHVSLENDMNALATANKMNNLKIGLMEGDKVVVEIPLLSLNPNERVQGRIVWRYKQQR